MLVNKYEGTDPYTKVKAEERGDVIAVKEDSHVFSERELASPNYLIIQCDGVKADFDYLKVEEQGDHDANPMLRFRKRKIDLDEMITDGDNNIETEAECKAKLGVDGKPDKNKKRKAEKILKTKAYVLSKVKVKPAEPDPAIISGEDPGVIG